MPSNSSRRLDEAMAAEMEDLSLSTISSIGEVLHLLADMLQAVNPNDHTGVKDEVIVDLVDRCRANQKKLMQMLATTRDEKLLAEGLELNDSLQSVLAKHDAIASGAIFPNSVSAIDERSSETRDPALKIAEDGPNDTAAAAADAKPPRPIVDEEEEDEDDDFAQLARRHSKMQPQMKKDGSCSDSAFSGSAAMNSALVPCDPPAPIKTTREGEDTIQELLGGLTLATTVSFLPPHTPTQDHTNQTPLPFSPPPITTTNQHGHHQTSFNNYVAPWARVSPPPSEPDPPPQVQSHHFNNLHHYPPPPWAATPGYSITNPSNPSPHVTANGGSNPSITGTGARASAGPGVSSSIPTAANAHKTFVPSYRLFEDLNVFGNEDRKLKTTSNASGSMSGKQT
ncbi:unnamed protein product [Cuscuta campestris]|uniref:GAT domain-containing protein n=1 Tax=Cuscuta campestris TaxID=132261 RepID=A0A484L4B7_9ASTE|nr:unnamed protein product [Cuscuta campestris]